MADEDQNPWDIGIARQCASIAKNTIVVADFGSGAVAGMTGYAIGSEPDEITASTPTLFRPLIELENMAPNSWYVNVLAVLPEHRKRGLGKRLLDTAKRIAVDAGLKRMSVIVAGNNTGARKLYERQGFTDVASRPCVRDGRETTTESWCLMMRQL